MFGSKLLLRYVNPVDRAAAKKLATYTRRNLGEGRGGMVVRFEGAWNNAGKDVGNECVGVALDFYTKVGKPEKGVAAFELAFPVDASGKPDAKCLLKLMEAYSALGDPVSVTTLRKKLRSIGVQLTGNHHSALQNSLLTMFKTKYNKDLDKKHRIEAVSDAFLQELRNETIPVPKILYKNAILLAASVENGEKILKIMAEDLKCDVKDTDGIPSLLKLCAQFGEVSTARRYYYELLRGNYKVDISVHHSMIHALSAGGELPGCIRVLSTFVKARQGDVSGSLRVAEGILLVKCCARFIEKRQPLSTPLPTPVTNAVHIAERTFEDHYNTGATTESPIWLAIFDVYAQLGDRARLNAFRNRVPPIFTSLAAFRVILAQGYRNLGQFTKATEIEEILQARRNAAAAPPPIPQAALMMTAAEGEEETRRNERNAKARPRRSEMKCPE